MSACSQEESILELAAFLKESKQRLETSLAMTDAEGRYSGPPLRIVLGNQSADADSVFSAICSAFVLHQEHLEAKDPELETEVCAPIINLACEDLPLRTEVMFLLETFGLSPEHLVFFPSIAQSLEAAAQIEGKLRVDLVDHNKLADGQEALAPCVLSIRDHHKDEQMYLETTQGRRNIVVCGSCATLVAASALPRLVDPGMASLLFSVMLLDTVNFDPALQKTTPQDERVAEALRAIMGDDAETASDAWFDRLQTAKFDVSALSSEQLLRRDAKSYLVGALRVCIPGIFIPYAEWEAKDPAFADALEAYVAREAASLLVVMFTYVRQDVVHRELAVYVPREATAEVQQAGQRLREGLASEDAGLDLQGNAGAQVEVEGWRVWTQQQVAASRKRVAPLVVSLLSMNKTDAQ